jgi:hypothetical protein
MILSHRHRFIFIKTEKTAGTSLEIALSGICGSKDIITPISRKDEEMRKKLGYGKPQNFARPLTEYSRKEWKDLLLKRKLARRYYNHMPAREIMKLVSTDVWDNYYKFCFERNPYDKVISHYYWAGRKFDSLSEFMESGKLKKLSAFDQYTDDEKVVVDRIYKYEEMDKALEDLSLKIGLTEKLELPAYRAKGNYRKDKRHYREILSRDQAGKIADLFSREMELMNYQY